MGYGRWDGKRQQPITPWHGSWAQRQEQKRLEPTRDKQWPIGIPPSEAVPNRNSQR